ncbi:TPA: glycosyltransferase [Candidatus Woesearchaeota archaeon]|nr:glycosyltransferase [Candidatus Woesearchaeota archaeon]
MNALVLFAKYPEPGKVKRKISEAIGPEKCAKLCNAFISDIITKTSEKDYDLYLSFIGHEYKESYRKLFPKAILYVQRGIGLAGHLFGTFEDLLDDYDKVVVLSCDVPDINPEIIVKAFNALDFYDVVIGPVDDGGYYLIGMKKPYDIFNNLPFGTDKLLEEQVKVLKQKKRTFVLLEKLPDVDDVDELKALKKRLKRADAPKTYDLVEKLDIKD